MQRIIVLLALAACSHAASAQSTHPLLGTWNWNPVRGTCPEVHTYRDDGTAQTRSGSEVLEKTFTVSRAGGRMYEVTGKVVSSNGGRDCLGSETQVGATSTVFIQPLNDGSYFTCASEDGMSCYGTAHRADKQGGT